MGADGVHSHVRQQTAKLLKTIDPESSEIMAAGFDNRFRILTCTSRNYFVDDPKKQFLENGVVANSYFPEHGVGGIAVAGMDGKIFWAIYIANDKQMPYPSPRYGQVSLCFMTMTRECSRSANDTCARPIWTKPSRNGDIFAPHPLLLSTIYGPTSLAPPWYPWKKVY